MAQVSLSGHFEDVNSALCELVGYTSDQLCTMRYESIVHPDAHTRVIEKLRTMIDVETPTWRSEGRLIHADGRVVWVSQSTTVVRDNAGMPSHYLAHYQDITDRKQLDGRLRHLAENDGGRRRSVSSNWRLRSTSAACIETAMRASNRLPSAATML